jgi:hypothetical protein
MYTQGGFPSGIYDGVIEAFLVAGAVETDITAIKLVSDVLEVFLELRGALACATQNKNKKLV